MPAQDKDNKATLRRFYDEVWNKGNLAVADELNASNFVDHNPPIGFPANTEGTKQFASAIHKSFSNFSLIPDDVIAEGDRVVARWTAKGAHTQEFLGIAPSGKQVIVTGIDVVRMSDNKIAEHWGQWDIMGMMQQLGAIPS